MTQSTSTLPRRWRAPAIAGSSLLVATVITLGSFLWWSHHAETRWRQTFHPPTAPTTQPIKPEDDAGPLYQQALTLLAPTVPPPFDKLSPRRTGRTLVRQSPRPPLPQSWWDDAALAAAHYPPLIALLKEASARPTATWPPAIHGQGYAAYPIPELYTLGTLITDLALHAHLQHRTLEALQLIEYQLLLADRLPLDRGVSAMELRVRLINHASRLVRIILDDAKLASPDEQAAARRVMLLLARPSNDDLHRMLSLATDQAVSPSHFPSHAPIALSFAQLRGVRARAEIQRIISQVQAAPSLAAARNLYKNYMPPSMAKRDWRTVIDQADDVLLLDIGRHAAATAIAWRLFELDHAQPPTKPTDLVPHYLPYAPIDPLDPTASPLRLITRQCIDGKTRPALYSVGTNGIDDTALGKSPPDQTSIPQEPPPFYFISDLADAYIDLFLWNPIPGSSYKPRPNRQPQ